MEADLPKTEEEIERGNEIEIGSENIGILDFTIE